MRFCRESLQKQWKDGNKNRTKHKIQNNSSYLDLIGREFDKQHFQVTTAAYLCNSLGNFYAGCSPSLEITYASVEDWKLPTRNDKSILSNPRQVLSLGLFFTLFKKTILYNLFCYNWKHQWQQIESKNLQIKYYTHTNIIVCYVQYTPYTLGTLKFDWCVFIWE